MYPYPTVAASNPRSAYSRPETVSAMHPSPKSASRREFGTLRPRKGTLKVYNHVSFRNLFDFAKHRSPLPATSTPACPGRQKKFRTPYAAASSFPSHPLALFRRPGNNPCPRRRRQRSVVSRIINTAPTLHACDTAPQGACGGSPSNSSLIDPIP